MDENTKQSSASSPEEQEIDLVELARKVWADRRLVLKWCGIAVVVGLVVAFSIPKEYTTTVTLAPETTGGSRSLGGLNALAGMAGINVGDAEGGDALFPELYPDIVSSTDFSVELFHVPVQDVEGELQTDLYTYLQEHQRSPWWSVILSFPFKCIGWITSLFSDEETEGGGGVDPFRLTKKQTEIVKSLNQRITVAVDKKTSVITLSVTMQDPLISAVVADRILHDMQDVVMEKKTFKAASDVQAYEKMLQVARLSYTEKQTELAGYIKAENINELSTLRQAFFKQEMETVYKPYLSMMEAVDKAKMKVQEDSPSFAVIEPASVPTYPSGPRTLLNVLGSIFIFCFCGVIVLLFKGMDK